MLEIIRIWLMEGLQLETRKHERPEKGAEEVWKDIEKSRKILG